MNRQNFIPPEQEIWRINLKEVKARTGMSSKQIADKENLSEKSVCRVFSGEAKNPGFDLVRRICHALGTSVNEIFAESSAVIGGQDLATLQADVDRLNSEIMLLKAENAILKDKNAVLTAESDLLKMQLKHKEEIISLHNYYNKLKSNN